MLIEWTIKSYYEEMPFFSRKRQQPFVLLLWICISNEINFKLKFFIGSIQNKVTLQFLVMMEKIRKYTLNVYIVFHYILTPLLNVLFLEL